MARPPDRDECSLPRAQGVVCAAEHSRQAIDDLQAIPITIWPVTGVQISRAADFSRQYGLLTNDALIVAIVQEHGFTHLASNDADFDRIPGILRYAPL